MDILIKGMELPKEGIITWLTLSHDGRVIVQGSTDGEFESKKELAKAIELPPHGRLGDLDRVRERLGDDTFICYACRRLLDDVFDTAPTIVEASECQKK